MKHILINTVGLLLACNAFVACAQRTDPVKKATEVNEKKADNKVVNEDVAKFLVESADARMMDSEEGKMASERGTLPSIRQYGLLMIKDQAMLLAKIKKLAAKRNISLPAAISNKKENGREDLSGKDGDDFDKKFIKMMIIDHERDIKLFTKAIKFEDREVSTFAQTYLSLIQSHLDKINAIKETSKTP